MKCYSCGHILPEDSEFCQYCGKKIEKEIVVQENPVEKSDAEIINDNEMDDIDFPDIENLTREEALDAIFEYQAEKTIETMKENGVNQPDKENDEDFGLVPEKPIYTMALKLVDGEIEYLNQLYTESGAKIKWVRTGSTSADGVNGIIDMYDTYLPSGELYKTIYINMYGARRSKKAPAGFVLNNVEKKRKPKKPKKQKKVRTKFCSRCGSMVDNETKICSGCGKKYFKGIKFTKPSLAVIILAVALLVSIIINFAQYSKIEDNKKVVDRWFYYCNDLKDDISNLQREISDLEDELWFYKRNVVIVGDDGTNKYHKYGCDDLDTSYFWAYNTEAAKQEGYRACSKCN